MNSNQSKQATVNIGTIGHVAHGKSTLIKAMTGISTVKFKNELVRNTTIKLGYANAKIYKCSCCGGYTSRDSSFPDEFEYDTHKYSLQRHVSFIDCPGHSLLMSTMLGGASLMDSALLLVAGNEKFPQLQTSEHLSAVNMFEMEDILVLQNKVDLVAKPEAVQQYNEIKNHIPNATVIPISAQAGINIDKVCQYIVERVPEPVRNTEAPMQMVIMRSFDVNKPGTDYKKMLGGVVGGSITQGTLEVGQGVEIRPGIIRDGKNIPIRTHVVSLFAEKNSLETACSGGLIAVGTEIDPAFTRGDRLVGQIVGIPGKMPPVFKVIEVYILLDIKKNEQVLVSIGTMSTTATVMGTKTIEKASFIQLELDTHICASIHTKLAINRKVKNRWSIAGWGFITSGK